MMLCQDPTAAVRSAVAKQMGLVVCKLWMYQPSKQQLATAQAEHAESLDKSDDEELASGLGRLSIADDANQLNPMQHEIIQSLQSLAMQAVCQLRQQYVEVCYHVATACHSSASHAGLFQQHFMPKMLKLAQDQVANVRLAVARELSSLPELQETPEVISVLDMLKHDTDLDVVGCITPNPVTS